MEQVILNSLASSRLILRFVPLMDSHCDIMTSAFAIPSEWKFINIKKLIKSFVDFCKSTFYREKSKQEVKIIYLVMETFFSITHVTSPLFALTEEWRKVFLLMRMQLRTTMRHDDELLMFRKL